MSELKESKCWECKVCQKTFVNESTEKSRYYFEKMSYVSHCRFCKKQDILQCANNNGLESNIRLV